MKRTTLGIVFSCLLGLLWGSRDGMAQNPSPQVPAAIKYQAVLRDVNGGMVASREDVDIRITLRSGDPLTGIIVYQEDFTDITTDAYGLVHLNIGRGVRTAGAPTLLDVPWGEDDIYVQVEIQMDGNGYTNMGQSELLTVPYAFMAARAGTAAVDFGPLSDGALPKYNAAGNNFVNSGLRKVPDSLGHSDSLEISASGIYIHDARHADEHGYSLPVKAGRKGQVLVLKDNKGTLVWDTVGGNSFSSSGGYEGTEADDERLLYWNDDEGEVRSSALLYHYRNPGGGFEVLDNFTADKNLTVEGMIITDTLVGLDTAYSVALRVVRLYAGQLEAGEASIQSAFIGLLQSNNITTTALSAETATVGALQSGNIHNAGTIDSRSLVADTVIARDTLASPAMGTQRLHAGTVAAGTVDADSIHVRALNAGLSEGYIWVGDENDRSREREVGGVITMDKEGVTSFNIGFGKGLTYKRKTEYTPEAEKDSLFVNLVLPDPVDPTPGPGPDPEPVVGKGGADSLWLQSEADKHILYAYNRGQDSVRVGIGTDNVQARLHVAALGGDVLFTDTLRATGPAAKEFYEEVDTIVQLLWRGSDAAFHVGGLTKTNYTFGRFSVSMGLDAMAQGNHALALGFGTRAKESSSVAIGFGSRAQSSQSLALGYLAGVGENGEKSIAIGPGATVGASKTVSIGGTTLNETATGSLVMGYDNPTINSENLIVLGSNNPDIPGNGSILMGSENSLSSGWGNNIVIGHNNDGLDANGISIGTTYELHIHDENEVRALPVGPIVVGTAGSNVPNIISIGHHNINSSTGKDAAKNTPTVVMIGRKLVNDNRNFTDDDAPPADIVMLGSDFNSNGWKYKNVTVKKDEDDEETDTENKPIYPVFLVGTAGVSNGGPLFGIDRHETYDNKKDIYSSVFETDVYINGGLYNNGTLGSRSDIRSKKDIKLSSYPLSYLDSLRNVTYFYKDEENGPRHSGFIAQHVQKYFPHLVVEDRMGMLNLKYTEFVPILWDFSAQLRRQNMKLEERNKQLMIRVNELEGKVEKLEAEMEAIRSLLEKMNR